MDQSSQLESREKPLTQPLTPQQMKVLAFIENFWHKNHYFPTAELRNLFPNFKLARNLENSTFRQALENRGITPSTDSAMNSGLTPAQISAILTLANFEDKRSRTKKLADLGISPTRWYGWLKKKEFREFLQQQFAFNFEGSSYIAKDSLIRAVDRGNTEAIKFYLEITGEYSPQSPQTHNVRLILARVVESIQRHVRDPELLRAIALDFENIMNGQQPIEQLTEPQPMVVGSFEAI